MACFSCLDDRELAQQEDWTLRQIFDHRLERPGCKVTKLAKELERMKMVRRPFRWFVVHFGPACTQKSEIYASEGVKAMNIDRLCGPIDTNRFYSAAPPDI